MHAHDIHVFPSPPGQQGIATVIACEPEGLCVDDGHARYLARRATSCLVEPMPGDRVWVVGQGEHFVLAVLDRPVASKTRLHLEGDVELHAGGALELTSERRLALRSDELHVEARTGRVLLDRCAMVLSTLYAHLRETTFVGKVLETLVERVSQHSKRSYRAISELDQVQAGTLDYGAEQVMHLHAKHAMVRAEQLVKMDADQIHLG
ncbi:DUF3540 domain-containing protein [Nannocystaceae bacterium ST9]